MPNKRTRDEFMRAYDAYADAIYRFCFFRVSNSVTAAEDLVQETYIKVWQYLCNNHKVENLRAFLYQTARNLIIDRQRRKETGNISLDALQADGFEPKGQGARTIEMEVECERLYETMNGLEETDRELLILRFIEGYGPKEIAKICGETPNAISVRIHRAKKLLKQRYAPNPPTL